MIVMSLFCYGRYIIINDIIVIGLKSNIHIYYQHRTNITAISNLVLSEHVYIFITFLSC